MSTIIVLTIFVFSILLLFASSVESSSRGGQSHTTIRLNGIIQSTITLSRGGGVIDPTDRSYSSSKQHNNKASSTRASYPAKPKPKQQYDPKRRNVKRKKTPPSLLQSVTQLAKSSMDLSTQVAQTALKSTSKAAYHLITPKFINRHELYGVWRLDQVILTHSSHNNQEDSISCVANIEFTPKGDAVTHYNHTEYTFPFYFKQHSWPRSCCIEFQACAFQHVQQKQGVSYYYYKGYFKRKLADSSVVKIVGKMYTVQEIPTTWKQRIMGSSSSSTRKGEYDVKPGQEVGTFVARRRLSRDGVERYNKASQKQIRPQEEEEEEMDDDELEEEENEQEYEDEDDAEYDEEQNAEYDEEEFGNDE